MVKETSTLIVGGQTFELADAKARADIGDVSTLATTSKNLVGAINEVNAKLGQGGDSVEPTPTPTEPVRLDLLSNLEIDTYIKSDGYTAAYNGWNSTDYIDVHEFEALIITAPGSVVYAYLYDEMKIPLVQIRTYGATNAEVYLLEDGAYYARFSEATSVLEQYEVYGKYPPVAVEPPTELTPEEEKAIYDAKNCSAYANVLKATGVIPQYYFEKPESPTTFAECGDYLENAISRVPKSGSNFIFVTDQHYNTYNAKHSPALIGYVSNRLENVPVLSGGDVVDIEDDKYKGLNEAMYYTREMTGYVGKFLPTLGNHDINTANVSKNYGEEEVEVRRIPYSELYNGMFSHVEHYGAEFDSNIVSKIDALSIDAAQKQELKEYSKMHYFYDDEPSKTRFISVVTGCPDNGEVKSTFETVGAYELILQYEWLADVLMSTPNDYNIVVCGHSVITFSNSNDFNGDQVVGYALKMCNMLTAFKRKESYTLTHNKTNENLLTVLPQSKTFDFSASTNTGKVVVMCGDMHWDNQCITHYKDGVYVSEHADENTVFEDGAILVVCTQADGYRGTLYDNMPYGEKPHTMTKGTVTEQCFDIVNLSAEKITLIRVGAGNDRVFNY